MQTQPIKVLIKDHTYSEWSYTYPNQTEDISNADLPSPLTHRYFHNDLVDFTTQESPVLLASPTRTAKHIPGVIILQDNRTYGRTQNKKRLLYKCVPDDRHLPHFLVPYDIIMDFSKAHANKYVLFKFQEWTEEHPKGTLVQTIGDVDNLVAYYEYQLYSKSLNSSLKEMTQKIKEMTKKQPVEDYFQEIQNNPNNKVQDWTTIPNTPQVLTIDPPNTADFDDGLSIQQTAHNEYCITVYIVNVVFWLDLFQLWNSFDNRIATIYLPDKRRPLLPTFFSETLCSLKENTKRFAIAIQFFIREEDQEWILDETKTTIQNVVIKPYKNYVYEDPKLIHQDIHYIQLFEITSKIQPKIRNSRDLVAHWMIQTNSYIAQFMLKHKTGIYRVGKFVQATKTSDSDDETPDEKQQYQKLDPEIRRYLEYHAKAKSLFYRPDLDLEHEVFNKKAYMRITSVIRRYEDVCNESELMRIMGIKLGSMNTRLLEVNYQQEEDRMNDLYGKIKTIEAETTVITKIETNGEKRVKGIVYKIEKERDGRLRHKIYVKGEGVYECRIRERYELYKEYEIRMFHNKTSVKGGVKVEILDPLRPPILQ
jgi:exoribonuclease R